jgi:TolB-like protein
LIETAEQAKEELWTRLRRRKVVQWGIAYVAAAWGMLQGLAYLSTIFQWPAALQRPAATAFMVCLPIALVLAWYHGDRGHQRVSGREFWILTVLLLLSGGLFWWVGRMPDAGLAAANNAIAAQPQRQGQDQASTSTGPAIAVLPFVNMSDDKANEYFSDGISEELLNVLVRVQGLGVASRTSSFAYKASPLGTAAIAQALKVDHVLEGSVRKSGNRVRITAQLIDAVNDRHLWSQTYDRELTDIFSIQEEIANAIVDALRTQLSQTATPVAPVTVRADTANVKAYERYLKARELFIARKDLPESIRLFEQVTQMDHGFARGWEGLAAVASVAPGWGIRDRDYPTLAREAAEHALQLDASLSMPWAALANSEAYEWPVDWNRHLHLLDRAIVADPRNATAYLWRGISWINLGFFDRAISDLDRALNLEPSYPNALRHKALALVWSGKVNEGLELFQRGVARDFIASRSENFVGPLVARGDLLAAHFLLKELGFEPDVRGLLIDALQKPRAPSKGEIALLETNLARKDIANLHLVQAHPYLWLGAFDRATSADQRASEEILVWERTPPGYRNSPAFKRTLQEVGAVDYWRAHGFSPQCRAVGQNDFTCD